VSVGGPVPRGAKVRRLAASGGSQDATRRLFVVLLRTQ
jgi:hypothetical protein